jgi:hypothetical protein
MAQRPDWLPNLKRLPRITVATCSINEESRKYLKKAALEAGTARKLYATQRDRESFFEVTEKTLERQLS